MVIAKFIPIKHSEFCTYMQKQLAGISEGGVFFYGPGSCQGFVKFMVKTTDQPTL